MIFILAIVLALVAGVLIGYSVGRAYDQRSDITRHERKQIENFRRLNNSLYKQAAQHVALGDPFAQIVMDEIDKPREEPS